MTRLRGDNCHQMVTVDESLQLLSNSCSLGAHEGISLLLKTIVGNELLQREGEEKLEPFERLGHRDFLVVVQGRVWPGVSPGSPLITFLARFSLVQGNLRLYLHRW